MSRLRQQLNSLRATQARSDQHAPQGYHGQGSGYDGSGFEGQSPAHYSHNGQPEYAPYPQAHPQAQPYPQPAGQHSAPGQIFDPRHYQAQRPAPPIYVPSTAPTQQGYSEHGYNNGQAPQQHVPAASPYSNQGQFSDAGQFQPQQSNSASQEELSRIRNNIDGLTAKIQAVIQQNQAVTQQENGSRQDSKNSDIDQAVNSVSQEISALKQEFSKLPNQQQVANVEQEIQRLGNAFSQMQNSFGSSTGVDALASQLDQRFVDLAKQLEMIRHGYEGLASQPAAINQTLGDMSGNILAVREALDVLPQSMQVNDLDMQLKDLSDGMAMLVSREGEHADFSTIEQRLDEITRAVVTLSHSSDSGLTDNLERIEARLATLSKDLEEVSTSQKNASGTPINDPRFDLLAELPQEFRSHIATLEDRIAGLYNIQENSGSGEITNSKLANLEAQLAEISSQLGNSSAQGVSSQAEESNKTYIKLASLEEQLSSIAWQVSNISQDKQGDSDSQLQRLESQLAEISGHLQNAPAPSSQSLLTDNSSAILQQIQNLSQRMDEIARPNAQVPETEHLMSLERQLSAITSQLETVSNLSVDFTPIEDRLGNIENQVAASRDIAIEVAREAAEHAVGKVGVIQTQGQNGIEPEMITALQSDLRELQENTKNFNTQNLETFDAVKDTLAAIASRLTSIEAQVGSTHEQINQANFGSAANYQQDAPSSARQGGNFHQPVMHTNSHQSVAEEMMHEQAAMAGDQATGLDAYQSSFAGEPIHVDAPGMDMNELPEMDTQPPTIDNSSFAGDADAPLEPGTGAPDLSPLMRQMKSRAVENDGLAGSSPEYDSTAGENDVVSAARRAASAARFDNDGPLSASVGETTSSITDKASGLLKNRKALMYGGLGILAIAALGIPALGLMGQKSGSPEDAAIVKSEKMSSNDPTDLVGNAVKDAGAAISDTAENLGDDVASAANEGLSDGVDAVENAANAASEVASDAASDAASNLANGVAGAVGGVAATVGGAAASVGDSVTQVGEAVGDTVNSGVDKAKAAISATLPDTKVGNAVLRQAAADGNSTALFEVGRRYTDGQGVEQNYAEAAKWYRESAERGFAPAQYRLGNMFEKGDGVNRDLNSAVKWYKMAADQGNVFAMHNMAALLADKPRLGEKADMNKAIEYFNAAANHGVKDSQFNLGIIYGKGMGVEPDLVQSYKWFSIVAKSGDRKAAENRDLIANQMRPEQLNKAKAEADLWKPKDMVQKVNSVEVPPEWSDGGVTASSMTKLDAIRAAQIMLGKLGFDAGSADGVMGKRTRSAIVSFQQKSGLPVDGKVTPALLSALKNTAS